MNKLSNTEFSSLLRTLFALVGFIFVSFGIIVSSFLDFSTKLALLGVLSIFLSMVIVE